MFLVLVFVVQVKADPDCTANRTPPPASSPAVPEAPVSGTDASSGPVIVMQHEDIERLLESKI